MAKNVVKGMIINGSNNSVGNSLNGIRLGNIVGGINLGDPIDIIQHLRDNPNLKIKVSGDHVTIKGSHKDRYGNVCVSNNTIVDKRSAMNCIEALKLYEAEKKKAGKKENLENRMMSIINAETPDSLDAEAHQTSLKFGIVSYKTLEQSKMSKQIRALVFNGLAALSAATAGVFLATGNVVTGALFGAAALVQMAAGIMAYRKMRNANKEFKVVETRLKEICDLYDSEAEMGAR